MARTTRLHPGADATLHHDGHEERWPVLYTALFVLVTSLALWTLIIAAVRWLLF